MLVVDLILAALMAISAVLQFNDPDPTYWVIAYGLGAVVAVLNILGKPSQYLAALSLGLILSGLIYAAPGFLDYLQSGDLASISGSMDGPATYVEPAREFLGLFMAGAAVCYYSLRWRS
jgi:hypothetical protein